MQKIVNLALIGAGNRGRGVFGQYAIDMPHRVRFTHVAEPDDAKRLEFAKQHNIPPANVFADYRDLFTSGTESLDGVVIATIEDVRAEPTRLAMEHNLAILVEKPLATRPEEFIRFYDAAAAYNGIFIVCHQMRLSPMLSTVKELVDSGDYGEIVTVQHSENLSYDHMAHSFVRGFFNNDRLTPMLLAKSCHDMDFIAYLIGRPAVRVASFGALKHFTRANCPPGAPAFCLEGCPHAATCPYHVIKLYFEPDTDPAYLRQMGVIRDKDHLRELLQTNRFGRCVYQTDNNAVDTQTAQIEFTDNIHVSFTMCGHNGVERRITKISMTKAEIVCDTSSDSLITVHRFAPVKRLETYQVDTRGTHGGGDRAIMDNFIDAITTGNHSILKTPIRASLEGHLLVFAAEASRREGRIIDIRQYEQQIRG
ncbi:MAG: Gfo/Idh/MocA family oxidoreductase [Lentisphaerae bacterium]|nr:Gfo/Idh/MocA family oxidoreductase [Lentisphaerota bacterium]